MTEPGADLSGYHHVTLNVQDVEKSAQWYTEVLGFTRLTSNVTDAFHRVILAHPSGVTLGVNRHESQEASEPFSERRAGLDHLAFRVTDRSMLEAWIRQLESHGVPHSEIKPAAVPGAFLVVFRDPDGIQLEVFSPPARAA